MNAYTAQAVAEFEANLKAACDMRDRKDAVKFLADKIGKELANMLAMEKGLKSSYYMA